MQPERVMKAAALIAGALAILAAFAVAPLMALRMRAQYPFYAHLFWPMLIYIWIAALPGFLALKSFLGICTEIGRNNSFSIENANSLRAIFRRLITMAAIFFGGAIVLAVFRARHPGVLLLLTGAGSASALLAVLAHVLSALVRRAAELKAENDLTI